MTEDDLYNEARAKAERAVIEAEQFKASLAAPQGMVSVQDNNYFDSDIKDDDDFCPHYLSCGSVFSQ